MKKKKDEFTYARTKGIVDSLTLVFNGENETVELLEADPNSVKSVVRYMRESGKEKIVTSIPSGSKECSLTPFETLKASFDQLCAIDTNSRVIDGRKISVCSVFHIPYSLKEHPNPIPVEHLKSFIIVGAKDGINPEAVGWFLCLKHLINESYYRDSVEKLGLVVDSELGEHNLMNDRKKPYYANYILPDYVQLVYGSSDTGKEYLPNAMLTLCDKASSTILKAISKREIVVDEMENGDEHFAGYILVNDSNKGHTSPVVKQLKG